MKSQKRSGRRKQLHILYLLNDLLHHTKFHNDSSSAYSAWTGSLQTHLVDLFGAAAAYDPTIYLKQQKRISELLRVWEMHEYYQHSYIQKLRVTVSNAASSGHLKAGVESKDLIGNTEAGSNAQSSSSRRSTPYVMPATHGDSSSPYYDLPAGNMMPHIIPNSTMPINPHLMKPLQFVAGPADESLVVALKDFMKDVDSLYELDDEDDEATPVDIDELGQPILHDEVTGATLGGQGYYGWSKSFCEKMKRKRDGKDSIAKRRGRSESLESNRSPQKWRRGSLSDNSRSRSRGRSRSPTLSRSGRAYHGQKGDATAAYVAALDRILAQDLNQAPLPRTQGSPSLPPPFLNAFPQGVPLGPGGVPIPPPPPPNYTGPWPPPPPPLVPNASHGNPFTAFPAFMVPPPPPSTPRNAGSPPFPPGPKAFQHQGFMNAVNWEAQAQHQAGHSSGGYEYGPPPTSSSYNGPKYSSRARGSRGGWGR
ncbi:hypothetical protein MMC24_005488 [Lignoscripta atroalba]|nr:hypothetical protein [Lignoscripta atroalba]